MPQKHSVKQYIPDGYYHIYNRGVEKRKIFLSKQDYAVYLSYLKIYLEPKNENALREKLAEPKTSWIIKREILYLLSLKNFYGEIQLLAYHLMPNHFHLLVKQKSHNSIDLFMHSLSTKYAMYFNKKNKRVGPLFQGKYKAVLVETDEQLLHLSRYIHLQCRGSDPVQRYSSYANYLGQKNTGWLNTKQILTHFSKTNPRLTYQAFVEDKSSPENELICKLIVE